MLRRAIDRQILWNRLIAVCEEQAQTMVRAAFSPPVREGGDLSAGLFDLQGRMIAQAVTGTPGHVNTMASAMPHMLAAFPVSTMRPGDAFMTNDPWLASGHLHDVTITTPAFHEGRLVGLFSATVHVVDVGGRGMGADGRDLFEEGILIPHMKLAREGVLNEDLLLILRANSREPLQVEGDLLAILAAGDEGARRLSDTLSEFAYPDLAEISEHIVETSLRATKEAIGRLKPGVYRNAMRIDGYDEPVDLVVAMTVSEGEISLDFNGTSKASSYGINVVDAYTAAYSGYGLKVVVSPETPNNYGSLAPFKVSAPTGSILNPSRPAPVSARHIIGHALPDVVIGCLAQAVPDGVVAESGMLWNPYFRGRRDIEGRERLWELFCFMSGGMGARSGKDGLSATAFPAGIKNIPIEAIEAVVPIVFWRKELRADSGGAGQWRGGLGQSVEISSLSGDEVSFQAMFDRVENPARGRFGGATGAPGSVFLQSGARLRSKGQQVIPAGDRLVLELPGGGGLGDPGARDAAAIAEDVAEGLVSAGAAARDYGWRHHG